MTKKIVRKKTAKKAVRKKPARKTAKKKPTTRTKAVAPVVQGAAPPIVQPPAFTKADQRRMAYALVKRGGMTQLEAAETMHVGERTIRNWLREVEAHIYSSPQWAKALVAFDSMLKDSINVFRRYLSGRGQKKGGDLEAAKLILQSFGIAPLQRTGLAGDKVTEFNIYTFNQDIKIEHIQDDDFAENAAIQIGRLIEQAGRSTGS